MCIVPLMKAEKDEKWIIVEFAKKGTLDFWIKFNPFVPNTPFPYPLKTDVFSLMFSGVEKVCIGNEGLNSIYL